MHDRVEYSTISKIKVGCNCNRSGRIVSGLLYDTDLYGWRMSDGDHLNDITTWGSKQP